MNINFEDLDFEELKDYQKLYSYICEKLVHDKKNYIFLDEIQHVERFELAVDSLFLKENCDIYLTGSNASLLAGELATMLTGRYLSLDLMPLSFAEFVAAMDESETTHALPTRTHLMDRLNGYMTLGAFPYVVRSRLSRDDAKEYLRNLYSSILMRDVVSRYHIRNINMLMHIVEFLMHSVGNRISPKTIADTLTSKQRKIDPKTVDGYLRALTECFLFHEVKRFDIKGRRLLESLGKYYAADPGLRNVLVRSSAADTGHVLENVVYLALRGQGGDVFVGQSDRDREIDFVVCRGTERTYYQVAQTTLDAAVLERELAPLQALRDSHPKYLLTLDTVFASENYDGIQKRNLLDWLMERR